MEGSENLPKLLLRILEFMNWSDPMTRNRLNTLINLWYGGRDGRPSSAETTEYVEMVIHTFCSHLALVINEWMTRRMDRNAGYEQLVGLDRFCQGFCFYNMDKLMSELSKVISGDGETTEDMELENETVQAAALLNVSWMNIHLEQARCSPITLEPYEYTQIMQALAQEIKADVHMANRLLAEPTKHVLQHSPEDRELPGPSSITLPIGGDEERREEADEEREESDGAVTEDTNPSDEAVAETAIPPTEELPIGDGSDGEAEEYYGDSEEEEMKSEGSSCEREMDEFKTLCSYYSSAKGNATRKQLLILFYDNLRNILGGCKEEDQAILLTQQVRRILEKLDPEGADVQAIHGNGGIDVCKNWAKPLLDGKQSRPEPPQESMFISVREFLIAHMALENCQRPGPLESATLTDLKRAKEVEDSMMLQEAKEGVLDGIYIHFRSDGSLFNLQRPLTHTKTVEQLITELPFADDCVLLAHTETALEHLVNHFSDATKAFGLTISLKRTEDLENRLSKASSSFGRLFKRVWKNHSLHLITKIKVYRAIVIPTLLYGAETWTLYRRQVRLLKRFHQRCLRSILNIKLHDYMSSDDVLERAQLPSIESIVLKQQLRCADHVTRMEDSYMPKAVLFGDLRAGKRNRGTPNNRYKDQLKRQLFLAGIPPNAWQDTASDHLTRRSTIRKANCEFEIQRSSVAREKRQHRKDWHCLKSQHPNLQPYLPAMQQSFCITHRPSQPLAGHQRNCSVP
ncbi:hypothetical protein AWC38_SpisGene13525 [Stylophora pistillata]|uniref:Uncharacterized protein n=1 Tax=Stylophora pistillata TaxID=50429 RepID=A0A2B4RU46_STYPI|nr:hypothetical protein AWC38_SpisGene13525 [Stylophora pistillata]